jgi:uncharacterized protein YqhQ
MKFKRINPKENVFYIFEIDQVTFSMFDSMLDMPIYHGKWNMCESIIRSIKKNMKSSSIYYYDKNRDNKLKLDSQWSYNI